MNDTIVVSGISGRFPESDNIDELWDNLMSGIELSSTDDRRWPQDVFDLPKRSGKIKNIEHFDYEFFGIANDDANYMDPQIRLLHETTWEAIFDAGLNPNELRGTKTGVYIGACFCDTGLALTEKGIDVVANIQHATGRISQFFDFRGPSLLVDTACASSFSAFVEGCTALQKHLCDNVVVSGLSVTLNPSVSFGFKKMRMISDDGRSKCLDADVDGYCRSEAVVSLFLQRRENAKRIYASVVNVKTNTDGYKQEGITFPRSDAQRKLMTETIKEANIDPNDVNYIEAHMTGTAAGDPAESRAIIDSYRPNGSEKPLLFGCMKSNVGHTEGASGCFAITKVCLAFQKRCLPPNLNFKNPNPNIEPLLKRIIVPVNTAREFNEDIVPVNSFGFGGVNVHVILKANEKSTYNIDPISVFEDIPRIIAVSGRQPEMVEFIFHWIETNKEKVTPEFLSILNDVSKMSPEYGVNGRGYMIVDKNGIQRSKIVHISKEKPLVLNFSNEIIRSKHSLKELWQLNQFKQSLNYAHEVLKTVDFDLWSCLNGHKEFSNITEQILITIVAQIAIVDTLKYLGVKADQIVADTISQISGDYFDDCITAKEAILIAYWISKCFTHQSTQYDQQSVTVVNDIMKSSKRRSSKWVNGWANSLCSLESYTNKLNENIDQLILKDGLIININVNNKIESLLSTFGEIFNGGHNLSFEKLYSKVKYPVSRETVSLSNLWKWNHNQKLLVTKFPDYFCSMKRTKKMDIDLSDPFWRSIDGHSIDKRLLFPATGYLHIMWCTLTLTFDNLDFLLNFSVEFKNVKFHRATIVPKNSSLQFVVHYVPETGEFEILEGGSVCVTGNIIQCQPLNEVSDEEYDEIEEKSSAVTLSAKEIYRELRTRGYDYGPNFRLLHEAKSDGSSAKVKWNGNWINFTDSVLQLSILGQNQRSLFIPTSIDYLRINAELFKKITENKTSNEIILDVKNVNRNYSVANGAMIIKNIIGTPTSRKFNDQIPDLEHIRFTPFNESITLSEFKKSKVNQYKKMCEKTFEMFNFSNENVSRNCDFIKDYIDKSVDDCSLLKMLYEMVTEKSHFENGLLEKHKKEVTKDLLVNVTKNDLFRPFVDLVFENVFTKTFNVLECNLSTNYLYEFLETESDKNLINISYKLLHRSQADISNVPTSSTHLWHNEVNPSSIATDIDLLVWRDFSNSLIIGKEFIQEKFDLKSFIESSFATIKPGGFLLLNFREQLYEIEKQILQFQQIVIPELFTFKEVTEIVKSSNFCLIGERIDEFGNVAILLRKLNEQKSLENTTVVDLQTYEYEWVENLKTVIKEKKDEKIWLRAADCEYNGVIGLFNCLRKEIGESKLRCVFGENVELTKEVIDKDLAINMLRNGVWGSMRNFDIDFDEQTKETEFAYLEVQTKGDLSSLKWNESPLKVNEETKDDEIICDVVYAALNFKDVMVSTGKVPLNAYPASFENYSSIGMEFSGYDQNSNRICGICESGAIASKIVTKKHVWNVPEYMSLEEAATIPTVYLTVYYSLLIRAKLRRNETILIHAGSGGVGQAAISVCLKMNCNVFTTVGTEEKKQFLLRKFPQLKECQIGNSRNVNFEEMVMKQTNGRGVDVVLNSLAEEKLRASVKCLADFGRFVEIGKYDVIINSQLEPYLLEKNITFHVICLAHLIDEINENKRNGLFEKLYAMVDDGIKNGDIKPLERHVFPKEESEEAMRFMANGKHIGKVLIQIREENGTKCTRITAIPRTFFNSKQSFILIGGLGGFGLEVAFWMVTRGATNFVLTSRNGVKENYQQYAINRLESRGAKVLVLQNDANDESKAKEVIAEARKLGEIGGIFIMSLVLKDNLFEEQSVQSFIDVCSCKVNTATLFDVLTRKMDIKLDYFVCFSSMVASLGNRTQTNYAFANSVMDRICENRRSNDLHGLSIQWGIIGDVGFVAEKFEDKNLVLKGTVAQRMPSCFQTLDKLLQTDYAVCKSTVRVKDHNKSTSKDDLKKQICHVLGIKNSEKVNLNSTLGELGLDSLMAVEVKQTLERDYDVELSILEIRNLSLKQLMEIDNCKNTSQKNKNPQETDDAINIWDRLLSIPSTTFVKLNNVTEGHPLFFIPPVDGNFNLMLPLTAISRPVVGINWTPDLDNMSSITEIASFYAEQLYNTYPQHEYEVLGYSFGAGVALEMCVQLQCKYGQSVVKKLMLLDGSLTMLKAQVEDIYSSIKDDTETERFWDYLGYNLNIQNQERIKLRDEIHCLPTKEEKIEKLAAFVSEATGKECKTSLLTSAIERYAQKSKLLYFHKPTKKFVGSVTLFRAKDKSLIYNLKPVDEDYGLSKEIEGNVTVQILQGFHETVIAENVSKIIARIEDEFTFFLV